MNKNFEIKQKLYELDECMRQMIGAFENLEADRKYKVSQAGLIKTSKRAIESITDTSYKVPKVITSSGVIYLNNLVTTIDAYERIFKKATNEAKRICTYVRDNLNKRHSKINKDYEDKKSMMLDIEHTLGDAFKDKYPSLQHYTIFFDMCPLSKDEFLGLFSFNRDKERDDCSRINYKGTLEAIEDLPDIIDGSAFLQFGGTDCVLLNNRSVSKFLMRGCIKLMKESGFNPLDMFQEITGKPLQSFTSKVDEFGNIVDMSLNRPNLKLV